jgi:hypothetical protein
VRPTWITGGKPAPPAPVRVVFLALEQEHVITQQDERVRAWTAAPDVAMVVHVVGAASSSSSRPTSAMSGASPNRSSFS